VAHRSRPAWAVRLVRLPKAPHPVPTRTAWQPQNSSIGRARVTHQILGLPRQIRALDLPLWTLSTFHNALASSELATVIPVAGRFVKLWRAAPDFSNTLFAAKLRAFITDPSLQTPEARAKMRERAESPESKKIGETLFLVLERLNDLLKPVWARTMLRGVSRPRDHLYRFAASGLGNRHRGRRRFDCAAYSAHGGSQ
jgi:hypothetical protein